MTKHLFKNSILLFLLAAGFILLAGCTDSGSRKNPADLIKEQYGDEEYKISFSSDGLDTPLNDLSYTAKSIPTLPTPQRVGYIFSGWFFDAKYQTQYQDELLLMMMSDVTLYAKWVKEELTTNGTYDIEFEAEILEETIREGTTAELYGGYKKFPENISIEDTYIEKSDTEILLKIEYDCVDLEPYGALADSYSVTVNASRNASSVYIKDKVSSFSDTIKTIYIRITDIDFSTPVYLDIETTNWWSTGLSDSDRYNTTTSYTVRFRIKRLIGFKTPYVDTGTPLDDGWYLVRSYYKKENNGESMASGFNAVYSYLKAENGEYTLIKPFTPYAGLVKYMNGSLQEPYSANLFYRMMSYMPVQYCFEVDTSEYSSEEVSSEYYPSAYNAKYYLDYSVEFHTDDYKIYSIIELGNSFKKELAFMYSVSGFMELASGSGSGIEILYMDYDHIIKLSDTNVDYQPLEGNSYEFESNDAFYPGSYSDINGRDLTYDEILRYGLSTKMINFYYSAAGSLSSYASRTVYNSKITFRPTAETAAKTVADSRYAVAHFNVSTQIYGYDVIASRDEGKELYYDSMSVQTFGFTGMRETNSLRIGKSLALGETVRLEDIYREKVSSVNDYSLVKYKAYKMKGEAVDFSGEAAISDAFVFTENIAVFFTYSEDGQTRTALVELVEEENVSYRISDESRAWTASETEEKVYVSEEIDKEGSSVSLPNVTYSWNGVNNWRFNGSWYDDEVCLNPLHIGIFANQSGVYVLSYLHHQSDSFTISKYETYVYYEFVNIYGERDYILFKYITSEKDTYQIEDSTGKVMDFGDVKYDEYGNIEKVRTSESIFLTEDNLESCLSREFYLSYSNSDRVKMNISNITAVLVDRLGESVTIETEYTDINTLLDTVLGYMREYSYFTLTITYSYFENSFISNYVYNITLSGSTDYRLLNYTSYFSNTKYVYPIPIIYSQEGRRISKSSITVYHLKGGVRDISYTANRTYTLTNSDYQFELTFNEAGSFYVGYSFYLNGKNYQFGQEVEVLSDTSDITITYVTDENHPFADGLMAHTVTYNLANNIITLTKKDFISEDLLFGWTPYESRNASSGGIVLGGKGISNYITKYNAKDITLYAIWDSGITVTAHSAGNADIKKTYFLDSSNGCYIIDLSKFMVSAPAGYVLAGWTGGFLKDTVKTGKINLKQSEADAENLTIEAVFRKKLTVKYRIDSAYSNTVIKNDTVIEGDTLDSNRVAIAKTGYEFIGWYVLGDETETIIDLSAYAFTEDTTLVAKFIEAAGE